jgi:predicted ATP-dependent endonuclease of OLD family
MLTKLHIKNYRCYKDHTIDFKNLTIIVGKNNAGKSTLIEALRLLSLITSRYKNLNFSYHPDWLELSDKIKGVIPSLNQIEFSLENLFYLYDDPPAIITAYFSNKTKIEVYLGGEEKIFGIIYDRNGRVINSKGEANSVNIPQINILPQISPLLPIEKTLSSEYIKSNITSSRYSQHFRNQINYYYHFYQDFKIIAESTWNGLQINGLSGRSVFTGSELRLFIRDQEFEAEVSWMGHGLQMWLQTMWFLTRSPKTSTIILDEPDVYMHADLQRKLIRFLKNKYKQVIIATHSIEIMSEVDPENMLVIDRRNNKSLYASNFPAVQRVIQNIGSIQNIELARLWSARKLLLVEGKDIDILKKIQDTLFENSEVPFDIIPSMSIGGWGGWNYAIGSKMLLKNAGDDSINVYCIFDSDYHFEDEIKERYLKAKNNHVYLYVWKKKEIENYLIVPSAIARIINKDSKKEVSIIEIERVINRIIDGQKKYIIKCYGDELYIKQRKNNPQLMPSSSYNEAEKIININWKNKSSLVSGKEVIKRINDYCNKNFNVTFSTRRIALELIKEEIDDELKTIVSKIEHNESFS